MTEPDEALIWAIESWGADKARRNALTETEIEAGVARADALLPDHDGMDKIVVLNRAFAYRAGEAASAERIKALEEAIDAARLEGIRLGLEAAAQRAGLEWSDPEAERATNIVASTIRALDPDTIAREAALDQLTREAQAQGMGYDPNDAKENTR